MVVSGLPDEFVINSQSCSENSFLFVDKFSAVNFLYKKGFPA